MLVDIINSYLDDNDKIPNIKDYGNDFEKYNKDLADYNERKSGIKKAEKQPEIPFPVFPYGSTSAQVRALMDEYNTKVMAQSGIDLNEKVGKEKEEVIHNAIKWIPGVIGGSEHTFNLLTQNGSDFNKKELKEKIFNMEKKSLIKTIIICITAIVCVVIGSYVYSEGNRYQVIADGKGMIDKFTKEVYIYDEQSRCYRR